MAQRNIINRSADALWDDWRNDIERITQDGHELFFLRRQFREIAELYESNPRLQTDGSNLWIWLQTTYASAILIRLRREVDGQANTVNLRTLLEEVEKRPDVVTRARIDSREPELDPRIVRRLSEQFSKHWVGATATGRADDCIDHSIVRTDRLALETASAELDEMTSRTLAHRAREHSEQSTIGGIDRLFDLIENLLQKYIGLLKGVALMNVEPTAQYDTFAPFMFPWHARAYAEWERVIEGQKP
jgi:hypothetical protein